MKFLKYLFLLLLLSVIVGAIYIAIQPDEFKVSHSRIVKAPTGVVFNNVIDLKNWESWSPWTEKNPDLKITLSDKTKGIGGYYSWEDKDGTGTIKTIDAKPYTAILQEMQFGDFPPSTITRNFKPVENNKSEVTWSISGKELPFSFKFFSLISGGMEKQIAANFERGLEKLDSITFNSMNAYSISLKGITDYGGGYYLYITTSSRIDRVTTKMDELFSKIKAYTKNNNITIHGMPFTLYHEWNKDAGTTIMSVAIPVNQRIITSKETDILCGFIEPGTYFKTILTGNYSNLEEAWAKAFATVEQQNLQQDTDKVPFEVYVNNAQEYPNPAHWITEIYIPVSKTITNE